LTSTYFEGVPPEAGKCGFRAMPLTYDVMAGNTTLAQFLAKIESVYGRSERVWVMDRGIPTEETLAHMRASDTPIHYRVGTPKGRLSRLERAFLGQPWTQVRQSVEGKLLAQPAELYVLARSHDRVPKERAMRRRRLKRLWARLRELQSQQMPRDQLLIKIGAPKKEAGRA
jgi:hypothetical protein